MSNPPGAPSRRSLPGFLALFFGMIIYAFAASAVGDLIITWPTLIQTVYYVIAGTVWIFPAVRILRWALASPTDGDQES